jgi:hypothetical protein
MVNTNGMTKEMIESLAFSEDEKAALAEARKRRKERFRLDSLQWETPPGLRG